MTNLVSEKVTQLSDYWRERDELLAALLNLANAADDVGVRFFDTDDMEPEVEAMQAATQTARKIIAKAEGRS